MIRRLSSTPYEKVWGSPYTEPWVANPESSRLGEIWFQASDQFQLLVKLLFTSDRLSVQVHPDDEYARKHENSRGKTEMWHILRAAPRSEVALGLRERITKERLREVSLSGEIEEMLHWIPARAGDTFFVPAGTIHAIGGGLVLCEVQQLSDITYRLYDYGRPRELHLDKAIDVADLGPYRPIERSTEIVECDHFTTEYVPVNGSIQLAPRPKDTLYVALQGEGTFDGEPFRMGDAFELSGGSAPVEIQSRSARFLFTSEGRQPPA